MAKRYHESKRARRNEHEGMERYERGPVKGRESGHSPVPNTVNGLDSYRKHEMRGRGYNMIDDDYSAPALLPRQVRDEYYPKMDYVMGMNQIGSLFSGEQEMMDADRRDMRKVFKPQKY